MPLGASISKHLEDEVCIIWRTASTEIIAGQQSRSSAGMEIRI